MRAVYRDGIIGDVENWYRSKIRLLFLGKEPNDRPGLWKECGGDLTRLFRHPDRFSENRKRFEKNLGRWTHLIHACTFTQQPSFEQSTSNATSALRLCAVVNLKKSGGIGASRASSIRAHTSSNWDRIHRQIMEIRPSIVLCCGTFSFVSRFLVPKYRISKRSAFADGRFWLDCWHPSARRISDKRMFDELLAEFQHIIPFL